MREAYQVTVDDAFDITGRGVAIVGVHTGGVIKHGDVAVLRGNGPDIPVSELWIEFHSPPGKLALILRDVTRDQVHIGTSILVGPANL